MKQLLSPLKSVLAGPSGANKNDHLFPVKLILLLLVSAAMLSCSRSESNKENPSRASKEETAYEQPFHGPGRGRGLGRQLNQRGREQILRYSSETDNLDDSGEKHRNVVVLSASEEQAIGLETEIARSRMIRTGLTAMGKVLANQNRKAIVSYPFPARVARIHARTGDYVRKGQELVVLQSEEVGEATSAFYKCGADLELAQVNYEREQRLFEKGVGAKKDFFSAEADLKVAQASLNAAEKKLHVLGFTEDEVKKIAESHQIHPTITLYAPIDGKIISGSMVLGSMVDETTEIMTIMDPSILWVEAEIYEKDIAGIQTGQEVSVLVPAYPEATFPGKISFISDILNESTRTITIRTEVDNRKGQLKPGMFASLALSLGKTEKAVAIPESAVLEDEGQKLVFVRQDGQFLPRMVQTGPKDNGFIMIREGVLEGDVVVTKGNFQLKSKLHEDVLKGAGNH